MKIDTRARSDGLHKRLKRILVTVAAMSLVGLGAGQPAWAIEGGADAPQVGHPYVVELQHSDVLGGWEHACSGVILDPDTVLTAASCLDPLANIPTDYRVIAGQHSLT
ncbi:MAG: trypsin-like serine protease, partial [Mycobacterium sp.]|nr:trypsin-like serine protease [Mycobacterium sp.]